VTPAALPLLGQRALVRGARLPALLTARVLAERYAELLLVIDADAPPTAAAAPPTELERRWLEALFPGITATLIASGAAAIKAELLRRVTARPNVRLLDRAAAVHVDLDHAIDCTPADLGLATARAWALREALATHPGSARPPIPGNAEP